ncbi:MAG TPA: alpha/beta fold hydrolase [Vicinamibacterales bacterium]|nr:alpha/beta fold hydrolase [Vicinamibacterales bacterium]
MSVGTHRLHIRCDGSGGPPVIFDAALGGSSLSWSLVQPAVARLTQACSYDRGGFGWSDAGALPRTAGRIADELHQLLCSAAIPPPYVLVGHSYGGLVMRLYASRHANDVAGLVLIEPAVPEEWSHPSDEQRALIARGVRLCRYGATAARRGLARLVSMLVRFGALGAARLLVSLVSRGGLQRADEGILAPIWKLPPEVRSVLREMWTQPKFFEALGSQIETICESAGAVMSAGPPDYGDLPLMVISSARSGEERLQADSALARRSTRGRQILAAESGHWIPLDAPHVVIDAITAMVEEIRREGPPKGGPHRHEADPTRSRS